MSRFSLHDRVMAIKLRRAVCSGLVCTVLLSVSVSAGELDASGDMVRGEVLYQRCMGCHSFERNRTGPRHCGLMGRQAGSVSGFPYSEAMLESEILWTHETLDAFLSAPTVMVPGTTMGYAGIDNARDRHDLITYIDRAGKSIAMCGHDRDGEQP